MSENLTGAIKRLVRWVRFGTVRSEIKDTINGIPCEVAYIGRFNRMVGYWAYGSFDQAFPLKDYP